MLSAWTEQSVGHLQLGAGVFLIGLQWRDADSAQTLRERIAEALETDGMTLGLTKGGGWFRCVPMLRHPGEEAGRPPAVDDALLDGWVATLSGTMVEVSPEHLAAVMPGARLQKKGRVATLTLPDRLEPEAYLPQLCWVGDTAQGLMLIELTGAMNVQGAAFRFVERGEGTLPFEFRAHGRRGASCAPCRVAFLGA